MDIEQWNRRYLESIAFMEKKIREVKGVIAAYNTNMDAIIRVRATDLERTLKQDRELMKGLIARRREPLNGISSKGDLLVGLLGSIESGTGEEWLIKSADVFDWLESESKYDELRMGGQAGNVANILAGLAVPNVIVHAASLPEDQATLFFQNVKIPRKCDGRVVLKGPWDAVRPNDMKLVHYVFEFDKGTRVKLGETFFESPRANRFVATWDPKNTELEIDPAFLELKVEGNADRAVLSGFHLLRRTYEDGSTHVDKIERAKKQMEDWKAENPDLFVHLELGDNKDSEIYASTLNRLSPSIDSIGLNENEMLKVSLALRLETPIVRERFSSVAAFKTAKVILGTFGVSALLLHTLDFSLCLIKKIREYPAKRVKNIRDAILFGALLAGVRAITGSFNSSTKVKEEAYSPLLFLSRKGVEEHEFLAEFLEESCGGSRKSFLSKGYVELDDCDVVLVVSKLAEKPATTAGLGDALIAGYILGVR